MSQCARPCCNKSAIHRCSVCLKEPYCSGECQKSDWKKHKLICKVLKRLPSNLQPYREVVQNIEGIRSATKNVRVLHHLLSYAQFQFGNSIPGKSYRQRQNGERIDNFEVEIDIMILIYRNLVTIYVADTSLNSKDSHDILMVCYDKMSEIAQPWSLYLDSDAVSQVDSLSREKIDTIFQLLLGIEQRKAESFANRRLFSDSEKHCQQALFYARRHNIEGVTKTTLLLGTLITCCNIRKLQDDFAGAVIMAEEAYNLVAILYNPVHPQV